MATTFVDNSVFVIVSPQVIIDLPRDYTYLSVPIALHRLRPTPTPIFSNHANLNINEGILTGGVAKVVNHVQALYDYYGVSYNRHSTYKLVSVTKQKDLPSWEDLIGKLDQNIADSLRISSANTQFETDLHRTVALTLTLSVLCDEKLELHII